jgi:hypothetical protein
VFESGGLLALNLCSSSPDGGGLGPIYYLISGSVEDVVGKI